MKMIKTVDNKITNYKDVDKMQQIYLEKDEVKFVSTEYENKEVPLDAICNLYNSLMGTVTKYDSQYKHDDTKTKEYIINELKNERQMFMLYMDNDVVKGFVTFGKNGNDINVNKLVVDDNYRKQGIGTYILKYVEYIADNMYESSKITLNVADKNTTAIDFYRDYGFMSEDESKESFWFISVEDYKNTGSKKYIYNNRKDVGGRRRFKCLDCGQRFHEFNDLVKHASKYHKDLVGDEDIYKYLYEKRNPGPYICPICNTNPRPWDPVKRKYKRICDSPECAKKSREAFRKNMKKVYGTDNLLKDPEHQAKMMANRHISGKFKFPDGVEITYVGNYELDFLRYLVDKYKFDSTDIVECPRDLYIQYYDIYTEKERWYIPDFFLPKFDLVVEIKDGSKYPKDSKQKSLLKDKAVIKEDKFNYIKIVDKDYTDFDNFINMVIENHYSEEKRDTKHIFMIPVQKFAL